MVGGQPKVTNRDDPKRKRIVVAVIVAVIMGVFVAHWELASPTSVEIRTLSEQIKQLIAELEYSDKIAEDFINMVISWEDWRGRPILVVWKKKVTKAKESCEQGKISKGELAKVEESIVKQLGQRIEREIGPTKFFDLGDVIEHKQANCLGYSQLLYILGNSTELSVKTICVTQKRDGTLSVHVACIVGLTDGKTMMVDLALWAIMSKPFKFEKEFRKLGNYWELIDKDNPLRIHRRIQIIDKNGLISYVYYNQGHRHLELDQPSEAIPLLDKAIELNPKFAEAYTNRGAAYAQLGEYTKVVSSHTKAIEVDPKYAKAYYKRGLTYALLGKYKEAKKDLLTSVKLDPALKADVKKIYMKLFEFPLVDFKLDTSAGSRNK